MRPRCAASSSGKPYSQAGSVRCAVEASTILTSLPSSTSDTASTAASSGRQSTTASAPLIAALRAAASLRAAGSMDTISIPGCVLRRSSTWRPVVPASPSMKTFFLARSAEWRVAARGGATSAVATAANDRKLRIAVSYTVATAAQDSQCQPRWQRRGTLFCGFCGALRRAVHLDCTVEVAVLAAGERRGATRARQSEVRIVLKRSLGFSDKRKTAQKNCAKPAQPVGGAHCAQEIAR